MNAIPLIIPYPRPRRLSDPSGDSDGETLRRLLDTPDDQLCWHQFQHLLSPFVPAGTYEESVYFLPLAFDRILQEEDRELDLITPIVGFVSENAERLREDGLLEPVRLKVLACFEQWTSTFTVRHLDREGCKKMGCVLQYLDNVKHSEVVCEGTCDLVKFKAHCDIAETFVRSIANHGGNFVKAAWFLEFARSRTEVYHPPRKNQIIQATLVNQDLLESAAAVVRKEWIDSEPAPTYWRDTLFELELADWYPV